MTEQGYARKPRPGEGAGALLVRHVPTAGPADTAAQTLQSLMGRRHEYCGAVYIVDGEGRLQGLVPLSRLFAARGDELLIRMARNHMPMVRVDTHQEKVATLALVHGVNAVPVVDEEGRLLGVVPPQALYRVLRQEHVDDLHRIAGIRRENSHFLSPMEAAPIRRVLDRLPWLLVGLAGSMLATGVVAGFEHMLQSYIAVAFFVPGIVYLADAIGTQTEAITVRGLSLSHAGIGRLLAGELRTGFLIGAILGALSFPVVWVVFDDLRLALAVVISLTAAGTAATSVGLLFPWMLARLGKDPALGSGPLATIFQDVLSLLTYFLTVSAIVL
ncbi:MAG: magnesium transporter [Thiobacillaceae bacterium]|jgi:magnesium transporter|nr:magnesium transporter [Thiobacillaceae bacterium]